MFNVAKKSLNLGSLVYHYLKLRSYPPNIDLAGNRLTTLPS